MLSIDTKQIEADLLAARLKQFNSKIRRQVLLKVGNAAAKPLLDAMKSHSIPEVSGLLKKMLGKKVKGYPGRNAVFIAVGPKSKKGFVSAYEYYRKAHARWFGREMQATGGKKGKQRPMNPAHYAHLAGPGRHSDFVQQVRAAMKQTVLDIIRAELTAEVRKL